MLISEFAKATGLSRDTVRFYVRLGLFRPRKSAKGGSNPYQIFTQEDAQTARAIRVGQSLGLTLGEIAALEKERREKGIDGKRRIEILRNQLALLERKRSELEVITASVGAKLDWLTAKRKGRPDSGFLECPSEEHPAQ